MTRKNIIIGLDGATWEIVDYFIKQNVMVSFREIIKNACCNNLKSTIMPITPSAWSSMITGCTPPKTGVSHFLKSIDKSNTYSKVLVNGAHIKVPTMWQILSSYGRDVISVNVPMTYPPRPLNGYMITGMMTPDGEEKFTYPEDLKSELADNGINYRVDTRLHKNRSKLHNEDFMQNMYSDGAAEFFKDLNDLFDTRKKTIIYLMENKKWQYFMFVFIGLDRIQHHFWDYIKDTELDPKLSENIRKYYERVDRFVGEIYQKYFESANLFIVSDHGHAKSHGEFYIDGWLLKQKYLNIRETKINNWKTLLKQLLKKCGLNVSKIAESLLKQEDFNKLKLSSSNIDWENTLAYGAPMNGICINLKGRDTLGCVDPGDYEKTRDDLIRDVAEITNSQGQRIIKNALKRESVYSEGDLEIIPDIILEFHDDLLYRASPTQHLSRDMDIFKSYSWLSGNHIRDGLFVATGKDIKHDVQIDDPNIEDILPTLFAINDEAIPVHIDGKIIKDIINREIKEKCIDYDCSPKDTQFQYSNDGEDDLKEKLKSLGYM